MKNLKFLFFFVLTAFVAASCSQQRIVVATDKNLDEGEFDKYETFTFAEHIMEADDNRFFWDSELMKIEMRNEVRGELEALGYRYVPSEEADLMVNFSVLKEPAEFQGWINNYADDNYWGRFSLSARTREPGDRKTYYLDKGTILVQMVDLDQGIMVWTGYASGVVENASFLDDDEVKADQAIERIFEEYNFDAYGK